MLTYHYVARNAKTGEKIESDLEADNEQAAVKLIRQEGLNPIDITLKGGGASGLFGRFRNRVSAKERILFSRQLSTLINAGLPLLQSLRSVGSQASSPGIKVVVNQIIADIEGGMALSVAMAKHPDVFNQVYISMIAAGETSGTLDKSLERLAFQQEKDAELLGKVKGAMVYPLVVLAVMMAVVGFMLVQVLPQVEVLYEGLPGANLPLVTTILLSISKLVVKYWLFVIVGFVFLGFAMSRWARTFGGKRVIDKLKMKVWPIGPLFMKMYMARFARTGATLVSSGVPLLQMLDITAKSVNNVHIDGSVRRAMEKVKGGQALSDALENDPNFLRLVPEMLKIGEQSGAIEQMLEKVADYFEKEVDNQIKAVSTIIEPVLMIVLGIVAFIIVAAVLLPIYGLAGKNIIR